MEESQKLTSLNFDKLNVDNYHAWEFSMRMFLIGKNLWEIVQGTEVLGENADEQTTAKFQKSSNLALATFCLGVSKDLQIIVRSSKTGKSGIRWQNVSSKKRFPRRFSIVESCTTHTWRRKRT